MVTTRARSHTDPLPASIADATLLAERTGYYHKFLTDGLFTVDQLLELREIYNAALADDSARHPLWIKKPQAPATPSDDETQEYMLIIAGRLAEPLARLPLLDYDHVTDEDDLFLLQLSCVQAGYMYLGSLGECYGFFEQKALTPILVESDIPPPGQQRKTRTDSTPLMPLPKCVEWVRQGPYKAYLASVSMVQVNQVADMAKKMTTKEREMLLAALGLPAAKPQEAPSLDKSSPGPASMTTMLDSEAIGRGITAGLQPLLQSLGALQDQLPVSGKRLNCKISRDKDESESEEETDADSFLEKEMKFGGLGLAKKARSFESMRMDAECNKIRDSQRIRKLAEKDLDRYGLEWNQAIDEETSLLIQVERMDHLKERDGVSDKVLEKCQLQEKFAYTRLAGLKEKQQILDSCLAANRVGRYEEAAAQLKLYTQELCEEGESKLVKRIRDKARANVKQEKELVLLEAVARIGRTDGSAARASEVRNDSRAYPASNDRGRDSGSQRVVRDQRAGAARGGASSDFQMRWVDGSLFDSSIAGIQCPDPNSFPGFYKMKLDAPNGGILHSANWRGTCGACGKVGHAHSECPPNKWEAGGQKYANVRWLYNSKFCDEQGRPN